MTDTTPTATSHAPNPIDVAVGARMRALRRERRISQTAFAEALGLTFQQIQKYEKGRNRISASKLYRAACVLKAPVVSFFADLDEDAEEGGGSPAPAPASEDEDDARLLGLLRPLSAEQRRTVLALARELAGKAASRRRRRLIQGGP